MSLAALAFMGGLLAPPASAPAQAAPVVSVHARTEIVLEPVRRRFDGAEVRGQVVDKVSREPIPGVRVTVSMDGRPASAVTNGTGRFVARFDVAEGRHDISVEFTGAGGLAPSSNEQSGVDIAKQSIELSVQPGEVDYSRRTIELVVTARTPWGGADITADLFAGPAGGDLRSVGTVSTDSDGLATVNLDRDLLDGPGRKRVRVQFLGNRTYNPAAAETELLLITGTAISVALDQSSIAYESRLVATGQVMDQAGEGVAGEPVALMDGTRRLTSALTDSQGSFKLRVSGANLGAGRHNVQAVFDPYKSWYRSSRSDPWPIDVAQPQPVPVGYTLAAFGATALAMLAFLGLRSKPWESWLARLRRQRQSAGTSEQPDEQPLPVQPGLQPARPGLVSTLRRPNALDFSGSLRDAVTGRPIAGGTVSLRHHTAGTATVSSDQAGEFRFAELGACEWQAQASAHGYVTEIFVVTIPHRGELRGARIDLLPVRERIFAMYREIAEPLLPAPDLWGIWTPRQIIDHVRAERPASALAVLTDFVEESFFSHRVPAESLLVLTEERIRAAAAERPGGDTRPRDEHGPSDKEVS